MTTKTKLTSGQNHKLIQIHQLLQVSRDLAFGADLQWLMDDIEKLDASVRYFHKEANQ